jgi:hypothetical protein
MSLPTTFFIGRATGSAPELADFFASGSLPSNSYWQQNTNVGSSTTNNFTFNNVNNLFSANSYKWLCFYLTGAGAGGSYYGGGGGAGAAVGFIWKAGFSSSYWGTINTISGYCGSPSPDQSNDSYQETSRNSSVSINGTQMLILQGSQNGGSYHYSQNGGNGGYVSSLYSSSYQDHFEWALHENGSNGSRGNSGITKAQWDSTTRVGKITGGAGGQGSANYGSLNGSGEGGDAGDQSPCSGGRAGYALSQGIRNPGTDSPYLSRIQTLLGQPSALYGSGDGANSGGNPGGSLAIILGLT